MAASKSILTHRDLSPVIKRILVRAMEGGYQTAGWRTTREEYSSYLLTDETLCIGIPAYGILPLDERQHIVRFWRERYEALED